MTSNSSKSCRKPPFLAALASERGMATGIVMILTVILVMIALFIQALNQELSVRDIRYTHLQSGMDIIRANIYVFGQNTRALRSTINYNQVVTGSMTCIDSGSNCGPSLYEEIALSMPHPTNTNGTLYYWHGNAAGTTNSVDGFNLEGRPCDYLQSQVTNRCVLRIQLTWNPYCGLMPCQVGPAKMLFFARYFTPDRDQFGHTNPDARFFLRFNQTRHSVSAIGESIPYQQNEYR